MKSVLSKSIGTVAVLSLLLTLGGCLTAGGEVDNGDGNSPPPGQDGNSAPVISGSPASAITIGQTYTFTPSATDPDGDPLTFTIENRPDWATFNAANGQLTGQPLLGNEGSYNNISISVTDGTATVVLRQFSIVVTQSGLGSTTLSLSPPTVNTDGTAFTDHAAFKIYYGMSRGQYPNDVYVDNPGLSSYVVENLAPGTYYFVATAVNQYGIESSFSNDVMRVVN